MELKCKMTSLKNDGIDKKKDVALCSGVAFLKEV